MTLLATMSAMSAVMAVDMVMVALDMAMALNMSMAAAMSAVVDGEATRAHVDVLRHGVGGGQDQSRGCQQDRQR